MVLSKVWGALVSCLGSLTPKAHLCPDCTLSHLPGSAWLSAAPAWAPQADKLLKLFHGIRRNLQGHYLCLLIFSGQRRLRLSKEDWLYPGHTTKQESCLSISLFLRVPWFLCPFLSLFGQMPFLLSCRVNRVWAFLWGWHSWRQRKPTTGSLL